MNARIILHAVLVAGTALLLCERCIADTIWIGNLELKNAKVQKIENNEIVYSYNGNDSRRELSRITKLQIDGETVFNEAEMAYDTGKFDAAVDGYQKTIRSTNKPWLKDWSSARLIEAANKSSRFDAAITAYVAMVQKDPALAARYKPALPDAKSTYLDTAVKDIEAALATKLSDEQKLPLLTYLVDIHRLRKDRVAEDKVAAQLDELLAKDPSNPAAAASMVRRKLQTAQKSLDSGDFAKAISEIDQNRALFVDPQQQADALFLIAEARNGIAQKSKSPDDLKDAAIAYMRVVANFKDLPARPHVVECLMKTALIYEQLNDPATAARVFEQITTQFPDDPLAAEAAQNARRLKK